MIGKKVCKAVLGISAIILILALPRAWAGTVTHEKTGIVIGLGAGGSPIVSGRAGTGPGAPGYDDAFKAGRGIALTIENPVNSRVSLIAGVGYENYEGKTYQGMGFSDLAIIPFYLGCKFHILTRAFPGVSVVTRVGAAHLSSVDVAWNVLKDNYWHASWVPTGDVGIVFEQGIDNLNFSIGLSLRYTGAPDNNMAAARADHFWSVPVQFSIEYRF